VIGAESYIDSLDGSQALKNKPVLTSKHQEMATCGTTMSRPICMRPGRSATVPSALSDSRQLRAVAASAGAKPNRIAVNADIAR